MMTSDKFLNTKIACMRFDMTKHKKRPLGRYYYDLVSIKIYS